MTKRAAPHLVRPRSLLLLPALLTSLVLAGCGGSTKPNILLITLDTTRVDRLSCYGHVRPTTPRLDELAARSTRYTRAYAVSSWTLPTHATIFTGKFPTSHGARYDPEGPLKLSAGVDAPGVDVVRARGLDEKETTLAQVLSEAGYATGGIVGGPWMKKVFGLDAGFQSWDDSGIERINGRRADSITRAATEWIGAHEDEPFFLFLNYYDPHGPFDPPQQAFAAIATPGLNPNAMSEIEKIRFAYDAEVRFMDQQIGVLLDDLRRRDLFENTWILVMADHGELLGRGGRLGHGDTLTEEEVHIPFFVKEPGANAPAGVSDEHIQQVDVMPMLLGRLGIAGPPGMQGSATLPVAHPIIAEVYPLEVSSDGGDWRMILNRDLKYLWNSKGHHLLVDLTDPPDARRNLTEVLGAERERMDRILASYLSALPKPGAAGEEIELDEETRRLLEGHGYLGDTGRTSR